MVRYSFDHEKIHEGSLILVNQKNPLRQSLPYRAKEWKAADERYPDILLKRRTANKLQEVFQKIHSGESIIPVSGYRSFREQTQLYDTAMVEHGEEYTKKYVAKPNQSEHQTGLAIDVGEMAKEIDFICPRFTYEGIARKFREEAVNFGFIERYPEGKETITGIGHEPWHFRYVGVPHAMIITKLGLTLEEYVDYVRQYPYDIHQRSSQKIQEGGLLVECETSSYRIFYVKAQKGRQTRVTLPTDCEFDLSGNNVDGFILTMKEARRQSA